METRRLSEIIYDQNYEVVKTIDNICIYCGEMASVYDHVPPVSVAHLYFGTFIKVPSCRSCNAFLSCHQLFTLESRKEHIIERILKRRNGIMITPCWHEWELSEIQGWVKKYIKRNLKAKKVLLERIRVLSIKESFSDYVEEYKIFERRYG